MKKAKLLTLLSAALFVLPSCGENNSYDKNNPKIEFWHTFGAQTQEALENVANQFSEIVKKEQGVNVKINLTYQGDYKDIKSKIVKGLPAGNTPTIAVAYPDHVADYLQKEGGEDGKFVYNLNDYFNDAEIGFGKQAYYGEVSSKDDFVASFIEEGTKYTKTGTYSLPFMKSSEALFYNKADLTKGYQLWKGSDKTASEAETWLKSATWDDENDEESFMDFCRFCADHMSEIRNTYECILFYDSDANLIISKMYQEGMKYTSIEGGKGKIDFEEATEKAKVTSYLDGLKALKDSRVLLTKGCVNKYGSDYFTKYQCMFTVGSTGGTGYNDPGTVFTPGVCKVPASKNNPLYITQGPTLTFLKNSSYSKDVNDDMMKWAWQFAKFLTSSEKNTYMCVYGSQGYLPVTYDAYETDGFQTAMDDSGLAAKTYKMMIDEIDGHYLNTPVFSGCATLRDQMEGAVKKVLLGSATSEEAVNDAISATKLEII